MSDRFKVLSNKAFCRKERELGARVQYVQLEWLEKGGFFSKKYVSVTGIQEGKCAKKFVYIDAASAEYLLTKLGAD